jgi:hypothetical protein
MFDLTDITNRKILAEKIKEEIDSYCVKIYDDGPRTHLGASIIGHECDRHLWFTFRWIKHQIHDGRKYRLFNRGHKEEARFIEWLRGIGFEVHEIDEGTGQQFRVTSKCGHYGGSLDGITVFPRNYIIHEPMLLEFKTNKTGSEFKNLVKNGVKAEKPKHYKQMCVYGKKYNLWYALYMCVNKNDDDIYVEIVQLDWILADKLEVRAETIIYSHTPPEGISLKASYFKCKMCDHQGVCHKNEPVDINCRSCFFARPVEDKQWKCDKYGIIPGKEAILAACSEWKSILP